ncbi:MAG: hypothetical protein IPL32_07965 [Chloracidobacterium sp.]|nr:hypothetical protein [Chloracidobacterium sp.]
MALDREFERFHGGPNEAASKRLHVTISPAKLILLNRNMYNLLGKPAAVYLNYSRVSDIIAIEPTSARSAEAFPVIQNLCNWRINAAPFCRNFNIDIDTQLKFNRPEIKNDALMLNLKETISVGGRKRRKKK